MALMTWFRAEMQCMQCGQTDTAWVESQLGDTGKTYEVGDSYDDDITQYDFDTTTLLVRKPKEHEPVHVLLPWTCKRCGKGNFAEVVLADGVVIWIGAVELSPESLKRLHYIGEGAEDMLRPILGGASLRTDQGLLPDWLDRLRAGLAMGRRWPGPASK